MCLGPRSAVGTGRRWGEREIGCGSGRGRTDRQPHLDRGEGGHPRPPSVRMRQVRHRGVLAGPPGCRGRRRHLRREGGRADRPRGAEGGGGADPLLAGAAPPSGSPGDAGPHPEGGLPGGRAAPRPRRRRIPRGPGDLRGSSACRRAPPRGPGAPDEPDLPTPRTPDAPHPLRPRQRPPGGGRWRAGDARRPGRGEGQLRGAPGGGQEPRRGGEEDAAHRVHPDGRASRSCAPGRARSR